MENAQNVKKKNNMQQKYHVIFMKMYLYRNICIC